MKSLKKITPDIIKSAYHKIRGIHAAAKNYFPARKMIVIGITGTKGKTSTGNYVWSVLQTGGYNTGLISSAIFRIGDEQEINSHKMTMPDPYLIQKTLKKMETRGIEIVIIEMTSEGMKQFRHTGIPVDIAIFTNLTPEHLTSHKGSFEVYKKAKGALFKALNHSNRKLRGKIIPRTIIANADTEHSKYYLSFPADKKITFGLNNGEIRAEKITEEKNHTYFEVSGNKMSLSIPGTFNVYNALPAIIIGNLLSIPTEKIREGLELLTLIPGRMELINEGQDFTLIVDYAHEPASMNAVITAGETLKSASGKIILLTGVIGGGRESRKPLVKIAAQKSDFLIITNEDPYDEDPKKLIDELARTAIEEGKNPDENLFAIYDRMEGIRKALSLAQGGDIVLITSKGAETTMMTKVGAIPWDERAIVRKLAKEYSRSSGNN